MTHQDPDPMLTAFLVRSGQSRSEQPPIPAQLDVRWEQPSGSQLHNRARGLGTTMDSLLVAGFGMMIHRYSGDTRLSIPMLKRAMTHVGILLDAALGEPDTAISQLRMLTEAEQATMLVEWNDTAGPAADRCSHQQFEAMAQARPDAVAFVQEDQAHSFHSVNSRANQLARYLGRVGVGSGDRVALCLHVTPETLIAMLAIMKVGAAYVSIDPDHPEERRAQVIRAAGCAVTIIRSATTGTVDPSDSVVVWLDTDEKKIAAEDAGNPHVPVSPDDHCYIMHTSGSTGMPKPIALRHGGVLNNLLDLNDRLAIGTADSVINIAARSFDMSVYELIGTGPAGARVILPTVGRRKDLRHLADVLRRHGGVRVLHHLRGRCRRPGVDEHSIRSTHANQRTYILEMQRLGYPGRRSGIGVDREPHPAGR